MSNEAIYTAAVIGTGRIGFSLGFDKKREQPASHTFALLDNKRIKIIAGVDTNEENLKDWKTYVDKKQRGQTPIFNSVADMYATCQPDIVVIAVNEDYHLSIALEVIAHKPKLIILEKPVALNVGEANKILAAAEENKVPVLVNHERRFTNDYNFAKNYFSKLGDLQTINARLDSGLRVYSREAESTGEYSLLHDGTHLVDIVQFLLENHTAEENVLQKANITNVYFDPEQPGVVRNITVNFTSAKCPDVNISMSGRSRYFGFEIDVIGREGRVKIGNGIHEFSLRQESKLYSGFYSLETDRSVPSNITKANKTGYFKNMVQNAVDFLDGKADLKSTLKTGINALLILDNLRLQLSNMCSRV